MKKIGLQAGVWTTALALILSVGIASPALADNDQKNGKDKDDDRFEEKLDRSNSAVEVRISERGQVDVGGAKITALSSSSFTATNTWGTAVLTWTVNTDANTKFVRRAGGQSNLGALSVGDTVSFSGSLITTSAGLTVQAKTVKNLTPQTQQVGLKGTVQSVNASSSQFVLATANRGNVTILVTGSTQIKKGDNLAAFADITVGAAVSATGVLNTQTNVLTASQIKIQAPKPPKTTLQGTLKSISSTTLPTTFVLTINNTDFTVRVAADTSILNVFWLRSALANFQIGNIVRVYGTVNADATIDATVVRNVSLR